MPVIDPSLFIHRFCVKLDFGEKLSQVSMTALRLLQRMKRDWMCHGRRPTGLVGAAILIAARYHGFKRTTNQIVQTVHVCDETIRKRIVEFKQTSVAKLTREEFEKLDLEKDIEGECDPPAFVKNRGEIESIKGELKERSLMIENEISKEGESTLGKRPNSEEIIESLKAPEKDHTFDKDNNEDEVLEEIDDDEINSYILTKEEQTVK